MGSKLTELISSFEELWPLEFAEDWDRPGLAVGNKDQLIRRVLLAIDVTPAVIAEAKALSAQLILAHHPPILRGVTSIAEDSQKGEMLVSAIRNEIAIYSAHTNADVVPGGVSDSIATAIGLESTRPLVPIRQDVGHGRIGRLKTPLTLSQLSDRIARLLPSSGSVIRVSGSPTQEIGTVALVGGAGDSFLPQVFGSDADVFITSDLRHHVALEASLSPGDRRLALIDLPHYWAEQFWLKPCAEQLSSLHADVEFMVSQVITDPWNFAIKLGSNEG